MKNKRLFLVDHMCVLPYGHNLNALVLFRDALKAAFNDSICLATRHLPKYVEQSVHVQRVLSYPYDGIVERPPKKKVERPGIKSKVERSSLGATNLRRVGYTILHDLIGSDFVRWRTRSDWRRVIKRYQIGTGDVIFFPSADFYGCVSLLDVVSEMKSARRPTVHLRLIGVLENTQYSRHPARPVFFASIRRAIAQGVNVTLSAETTTYATYVKRLIPHPVTYLPYPLSNELRPITWGEVKVIASPGQGRADKGFFRLFSIFSHLCKIRGEPSFRFDVQNMSEPDKYYRPRYVSILSNVPQIRLRKARLTQEEIDGIYSGADILLLPYDADTYALRGSAVYQEGLAIGRPVVSSVGTGQADLVLRYQNGLLASSDEEFARRIDELASKPKHEIERMVLHARSQYEADFQGGLSVILRSLTQ